MNNTAHFGITNDGKLIALGVGANNEAVANLLADNVESIAVQAGAPVTIVTMLDINDLYRLRGEMTDVLNNLDNEALGGPVLDYGIPTEEVTV